MLSNKYLLFINKYLLLLEYHLSFYKMSQSKIFTFRALHIIAWLIFVGLSIEAGALIVNFIFSLYRPELVQRLYQKLDLGELYSNSQISYFAVYGFILSIAILKAFLFYIVIMLMHKMDLSKPFNTYVARQILLMSRCTIAIGLLSYIGKQIAQGCSAEPLEQFWGDSEAFILMGAVIYIIAVIFRKGVEIQNENDLTV